MSEPQPKRRSRTKLQPLDWRELADDSALKGNLSTLYVRPNGPVPEYVSEEARREIEKRGQGGIVPIGAVAAVLFPVLDAGEDRTTTSPVDVASPDVTTSTGNARQIPVDASSLGGTETSTVIPPTPASTSYTAVPVDAPSPGDIPSTGDVLSSGSFADGSFADPTAPPVAVPSPVVKTSVGRASQIRYRTRDGVEVEARKVHRAVLVQHGHSATEQIVYQTLWNLAGDSGNRDVYRDVCIGYDRLSGFCAIAKRNVLEILKRLIQKLAIEQLASEDSAANKGKTYRVYGMSEILERRREAGLQYVIRHKGVDFVWPVVGTSPVDVLSAGDVPSTDDVSSPGDIPSTGRGQKSPGDPSAPGDRTSTHPIDNLSSAPVDVASSALGSISGKGGKTPSSVVEAINKYFGFVDDDVLRRIVTECRDRVRDATEEEIAHFVGLTANRIRKMKNLNNPVGMLITQVPKCFDGQGFQSYREAERHRREAGERQLHDIAKAVLDDPQSSSEDREWARSTLRTK